MEGPPGSTLHAPSNANLILFDDEHRRLVGIVVALPDHSQPPRWPSGIRSPSDEVALNR
jgi:hypothetical protein